MRLSKEAQQRVRMVVPFPPAGATDILARVVGKRLTEVWDQNVISGEH